MVVFSFNNHILYIFVFFLVAVGEEVSVRGFILKNLSSALNKYIALVLSSLVYVYLQLNIGVTGVNFNMIAEIGIVLLLNFFLFGILLGLLSFIEIIYGWTLVLIIQKNLHVIFGISIMEWMQYLGMI